MGMGNRKSLQDLIVVGAGPAGLSAAATAAELGLTTLVLDEQPSPGGQLYRNIERVGPGTLEVLGHDYAKGLNLLEKFRKSGAGYQESAIVWNIEHNGTVCYSRKGKSTQIAAKRVIVAIGATERPVAFPGWSLPGVMGAGAIDANFKSSGTIPAGPVVLCGSGPLLLLVIGHLNSLGVEIRAVLDTTPSGNMLSAIPMLPGALRRSDYLLKGIAMLLNIKKSRIRYYRNVTGCKAHGSDQLKRVSFTSGGKEYHLETKMLLVHEGVVPRCDFSQLLGLKHHWDPVQRYWYPQTDRCGATASEKIYVAGDSVFVHGGIPATLKGSLAALDIAEKLNLLTASEKAETVPGLEKELQAELMPRPFIDALYKPRKNLFEISDETLVCRCEEVTAGVIRQTIREGCREPNEIKTLTRCGMGNCQGRMCGTVLAEIVAAELQLEPHVLKPLSVRAPVRNLSLRELSEVDLLENPDQ